MTSSHHEFLGRRSSEPGGGVPTVAIVGGGPGGLFTAYRLQCLADRPYRVTIFEGSDRIGGKVLSGRFSKAPVTYEIGAAELYDNSPVGEDPLRGLVASLGLPVTAMAGHTVHSDGRFLSTIEDLIAEFGPSTGRAVAQFDLEARGLMSPSQFYDSDQAESFANDANEGAFAQMFERIDDPKAKRYLQHLIHSDLATETDRTNMRYGLQNYLMNDTAYMELYSIDGGNDALMHEIGRRLLADVRLGQRVTTVEALASGRTRLFHGAPGEVGHSDFDHVVLALPHGALQGVSFRGEELASRMAAHLSHFDHPAHYLRVSILFESPFWKGVLNDSFCMLEDFGGCCLYDESSRVPNSEYGVLGWLIGGDHAVAMSGESDDSLIQAMLGTLPGPLAAGRTEFLEGAVHRWLGSVNAMPGGRVALGFDQRHFPAPTVAPNLMVVGDYLYDSTLNGVLESAEYAAGSIAASIA